MALNDNLPGAGSIPNDSDKNTLPHYGNDNFTYNYDGLQFDAWDQYRPYQFLLVEATEDGYKAIPKWRYTLPIPPQELSIDTPTADTVSATLTGYTEILGGAPFRPISFQGTMGVNPGKPSVDGLYNGGGPLVRAVVDQARSVASSAKNLVFGQAPRIKNDYDGKKPLVPNTDAWQDTGFTKWHQLRIFLEGYINLKQMKEVPATDESGAPAIGDLKGIDPANIRLAFCVWKDNSTYLVTLKNFTMRKTQSAPLEYQYNIQLQAYSRINIDISGGTPSTNITNARKPNLVSDILNRIQAARDIIQRSKRLLSTGLLGPLSIVGEVGRQLAGFAKDVLGLARSIAEMPATFARECANQLRELRLGWEGLKNNAKKFENLKKIYDSLDDDFKEALGIKEGTNGNAPPYVANPTSESTVSPVTGKEKSVTPTSGQVAPTSDPSEPDPRDFPSFAQVNASIMAATASLQAQLQKEIERSFNITLSEVENLRNQLRDASDYFTSLVGAWSPTYQEVYELPTPDSEPRMSTQEELDVMNAMNELILAADKFVVYMQDQGNKPVPVPTSLEYVAGLAASSGIAFIIPTAKFAVPFPYGATLETLAVKYLGDANRWHEIATLNGLRSPYVDEVGFVLPLLVNGNGNKISVNDATNLFLRQTVWISDDNTSRTKRRILDIVRISPTNFIITVDGEADMANFRTDQNAKLESFLPATVNSRQVIYIPTQGEPDDPEDVESIPGVNIFDPLLRVAGVDLLLNDAMDVVITEYGDNPLSYGMRNVVQTLEIGFSTPKGALKQHPAWGVGLKAGDSLAEVNASDVIASARNFVNADPTFTGLRSASINVQGVSAFLNVDVGIANYQKSIPVKFALKG